MDVRGHGESHVEPSNSSHTTTTPKRTTFEDCVRDMDHTLARVVPDLDDRQVILMGHSMGGRLSLMYTLAHHEVRVRPSHVWLLDTVPGRISGSVQHVLNVAQQLVQEETTKQDRHQLATMKRTELADVLMQQFRVEEGTAQWLAASFDPKLDRKFKFDLSVAQDLVEEFHRHDFLAGLQQVRAQQPEVGIHLVRGGANAAWEDSDSLEYFETWEQEEEDRSRFSFHTLPDAGHWVHIDDPRGLLRSVESIHKEPEL